MQLVIKNGYWPRRGYGHWFCMNPQSVLSISKFTPLHEEVNFKLNSCVLPNWFWIRSNNSVDAFLDCSKGGVLHSIQRQTSLFSVNYWKRSYLITAASLICLFPTQILLRESKCASKSRELVWFVNQDTCCQFVSVVWLEDGRGPDATSMLSLAEENKEKKHADSAFCSAIFPSCSRPVGPQPAGGETVDGWDGSPEPQQLPGASVKPSEAL